MYKGSSVGSSTMPTTQIEIIFPSQFSHIYYANLTNMTNTSSISFYRGGAINDGDEIDYTYGFNEMQNQIYITSLTTLGITARRNNAISPDEYCHTFAWITIGE